MASGGLPSFAATVSEIDWFKVFGIAAEVFLTTPIGEFIAKQIRDAAPAVAAEVLATRVRIQGELGRALGEALGKVEAESEGAMAEAVAFGLRDFFGVNVSAGDVRGSRGITGGNALSQKIGGAVLDAMFGAFEGGSDVSPEAGRRNAERMLTFNLSTALEGWMQGVLGTGFLSQWFPNWADLDDMLQQSLGLGRINRRILQPLLDAMIIEPFERDINARMAPKKLSEAELMRALHYRFIPREQFDVEMGQHGRSRVDTAVLVAQSHKPLDKNEIARLLELGILTHDVARDHLMNQGYTETVAELVLMLGEEDRIRAVFTQAESTGRRLYQNRNIDEGELRRVLRGAGRSEREADAIVAVGDLDRSEPPRLPRGVMEEAFREGLIALDRLRGFYLAEGYALEDVLLLEQLALKRKFEEEEREREAAAAQAARRARGRT